MVANMRRTVLASVAVVSIAMAGVGPVLGSPTTLVVPDYSFESTLVPDGSTTPYPTGQTPPSFGQAWNPPVSAFPGAGGNGSLPGTAAGSQCFVNPGTSSQDPDVGLAMLTDAAVAPNTRYTMTVAIGSALTATINNGNSLAFADVNYAGQIASHDDLLPNGYQKTVTPFLRTGTFGDISYSIASQDFINGTSYKVGDNLAVALVAGAGTCWDNVRLISQNWYPLYSQGNFTWDSNSTAVWSPTSGGSYTGKWAPIGGKDPDAVFEGTTGGTVNVSGNVTANSLNFFNDATMPSYTLQGSGTITLTGDATITSGAGTNDVNNYGGGNNTITCVLAGGAGMYKAGGGTLVLTGANTYLGGTTVGGGTLQIGAGGTTGSIGGDVSNLANLAFNRSNTITVTGNISGTGSADILGGGRTIFAGNNTYTGATSVKNGALQINNASATMNVLTNAGGVDVTGGYLVLDYSASGTSVASTVQNLLKTAYNNGTNNFQTGQIRDTLAMSTAGLGLGWVDNATTKQITIMPALYGDANLSGKVDFTDLSILLSNYGKAGTCSWSQGDFNYDSTVNFTDLSMLLGNWPKHGPLPLSIGNIPDLTLDSQAIQLLASDNITVSGTSPVPEPSSLVMLASLLALGGAWGIRRQRSRR
jgi:autotransporter-associated beta strand protein